MGIFRWHERHRGAAEDRRGEIERQDLDEWRQNVNSAAKTIERWRDAPQIKDWNLRQLEIRRRSIERGEKQR